MVTVTEKIGKYEVKGLIGRGGMGEVYLGYDPFADREVAIKVNLAGEQDDQRTADFQRKMFYNEAHTAGLLDHVNILKVHDAGIEGDLPYIVMEYVPASRTLKEHCAVDRLLPIKDVVEVVFKCARALEYAHRMGVVHRDIKPTNIMLTADRDVKIGDFGIAARNQSDTTQVMGIIGSPRYMSPEQAQEEDVTSASDLFSLGVVMYELLTGRPPFTARNFSRLIYTIIHDNPLPPSQVRSELPAELDAIVLRLLAKHPGDRYRCGNDLAADLTRTFGHLERLESDIDNEEKFAATRSLEFFNGFTDTEVWEVIRAGIWEQYTTGDRIITEGNVDQSLYIVVSGDVMVKKHSRLLGTLEAGDCFGEMGYLTHAKRTASIFAVNNVLALKVNEALIEQASVGCQLKFLKVFLRTLVTRLTAASEALASN